VAATTTVDCVNALFQGYGEQIRCVLAVITSL
jgi:hypothetical protein